MKKKYFTGIAIGIFFFLSASIANAALFTATQQGAATLPNAPAYDWWYGCSPTSAGMMMGYYDTNGYGGLAYDNLVDGTATSDFQDSNVRNAIASQGHRDHFYPGDMASNFGVSGDDVPGRTEPDFNSLADFMGTSQDAYISSNGSTWIYTMDDGSRLYAADALGYGFEDKSGMYGIMEYINWAGYGVSEIFNQSTDNQELTYGFSYSDYQAEIDADRVVMLHIEGHSMFGYGYDDSGNILFHDTWDNAGHSMAWGSSYDGRELVAVTAFTLAGGSQPVPEPATLILFGTGLAGLIGMRRKAKR